ncbi:MAG: imidazoleglycerol-phosphate dehydratase HisB [Candidatus Schekmanbacteria bacterium]|nr:MAG: imidazoleglycerol-phosphate dehydratase HisB [Candidatus Schekmanbacteria bacterium]
MSAERKSNIKRESAETKIKVNLNLDGKRAVKIDTGIPFMNHMLELFAKHGGFSLRIQGRGDTEVDCHHTVEDLGIVIGQAFRKALGKRKGIERYGEAFIPMDESLARVVIDISGRPYLYYDVKMPKKRFEGFDYSLIEEFLRAFSVHSATTIHISLLYGKNQHHICEAIFKALAVALKRACAISGKNASIPSTKGVLDL